MIGSDKEEASDDEAEEDRELLSWSDDGESEDEFALDEDDNNNDDDGEDDESTAALTTWITQSSSATFAHSQSSSVAVSLNCALNRQLGEGDEMCMVVARLLLENKLLKQKLTATKSQLEASNAHATVMSRAASEAQAEASNHQKKTRKSLKTSVFRLSCTNQKKTGTGPDRNRSQPDHLSRSELF